MPARRYRAPMPELFTIARRRVAFTAPADVTPFPVVDLVTGEAYLVTLPTLEGLEGIA